MDNKTAVECLVEQLNSKYGGNDFLITHINEIEKAKEMEKDRMIQFAKQCLDKALDLDVRTAYSQVEKYYEQTYGGNEQ